jgi:RHS repeat-associated protein
VEDAATGLVYMQQRYYDPMLGIFYSVDPVTTLSNPTGMFHRYRYAASNPYKFTDPDGRQAIPVVPDIHNPNHADMIQAQVDTAQAAQIATAARFEAMKYENRQAALQSLAATSGAISIASVKVPPVSITAGAISLLSGGAAFVDSEINGKSTWVDRTLFAITTSPYAAALRLTRLAELAKPVHLAQTAGGVAGSASSAVAAGVDSNRSGASEKATRAMQGIPINRIEGRIDSNRLKERHKK